MVGSRAAVGRLRVVGRAVHLQRRSRLPREPSLARWLALTLARHAWSGGEPGRARVHLQRRVRLFRELSVARRGVPSYNMYDLM